MAAAALMCGCADKTEALLTVDLQDRPVNVPQDLWGIFFEEINHAGDGGIWPEMIYNMGFEEKDIPTDCTLDGDDVVGPRKPNYAYGTVRDYRFHHFDPNDQSIGWTIEGQNAAMRVVTTKPLSEVNLHLCLQVLKLQLLLLPPCRPLIYQQLHCRACRFGRKIPL